MNDNERDYKAEKSLADAIRDAFNSEFGFIPCGKSFDELMEELNNEGN